MQRRCESRIVTLLEGGDDLDALARQGNRVKEFVVTFPPSLRA